MKNLRDLRLKLGVSLKDLGSIFGLAESTISLYETGKRQPDNETLIKLADYFNVSTDYLLGRTDEKTDSFQLNTLPHELDLISSLRKLNDEGRAKAVEYITDLTSMDKYIK